MPKGFRVAPVEGRMILDPFSIGASHHRRLGYEKKIDGTRRHPTTGAEIPREKWEWTKVKEEIVGETSDHFVRRAITDGDLDYIASVEIDAARSVVRELPLEADLVRITARNRALRARAAKLATAEQAKAPSDKEIREQAEKEAAEYVAALDVSPPKPATPAQPTPATEQAKAPSDEPTTTPPAAA